jgi:HEAT repeat protein
MDNLASLLSSRRTEDRIRAVQQLAGSDDPAKQTLLMKALSDRSNYVAALAAEALSECADMSVAQEIVERFLYLSEDGLKRDPGCHVRAHLAIALGRLGYSPAVHALRVGIRTVQIEPVGGVPFDTGAHLRANCALALAQMNAPDAVRDIALLLFDVTETTAAATEHRKVAARALARLGDPNAIVPLALKLTFPDDESADVLQECMQAVVELEDPRALELLQPYLEHHDQDLAAFAALMIAQTRAPEAPMLIRDVIPRLSGDPLKAAVLALTVVRSEEGRAVLHDLATDRREQVRLAVVEALASVPDEANRERLQQMAKEDRSTAVRNAAKHALPT